MAVPPAGKAPRFAITKNTAAVSNATPMHSWIARRGSRPTTPAPSQAPMVALATMVASSTGSTATTVVNYLEIDLQPSHGAAVIPVTNQSAGNIAAIQIEGMTGAVHTYRP